MINFNEILNQLPDMPAFKARWVAIYLEPMMASGERLTVAVAALGDDGSSLVKSALRPEKARAMYAGKADAFLSIIDTLVSSLQFHLHISQTFTGWVKPFSGIAVSDEREAVSTNLLGVLRQAVAMSASLSALDFEMPEDKDVDKSDIWANKFKEQVISEHPELESYFKAKFRTNVDSKDVKVFFLSSKVAVNTGKLIPGSNISYNFDINKSRILDLLTIKEKEGDIAPRAHHELIVYRPRADDTNYSDYQIKQLDSYVNALVDAGDKQNIRVTTASSVVLASERLRKLEYGY
ncbi:hypothetical protein CIG19_21180 [Enterobacterales bacterium CwR94]|nr:hypothetical protein CIG19_21180 [Enterobacterales bacterium CwR94]